MEASGAMANSIKRDSSLPIVKDRTVLSRLFPDSEFIEYFEDGSYIRKIGSITTEREYVFGNPLV